MSFVADRTAPGGAPVPGEPWRRLVERLLATVHRRTAVDDFLDGLVELVGADRGLVLVLDPEGVPFAVNARGHARALSPLEREEVSRSIIDRALGGRGVVLWENADGRSGGSMAAWGILSALAAPLYAAGDDGTERLVGALYVDFRNTLRRITDETVALFEFAASLGAAVLEQARRLQAAGEQLRRCEVTASAAAARPGLDEILAAPGLAPLRGEILSAAYGRSPVLLLGESGTGKTLLAEAMAAAGGRGSVIRALLGTSDDLNTIASELFGHGKGAFSGALARRTGLVELAHGGTLIFDELLNLPAPAQKLLLDFAQFGTYRPLGYDGREPRRADVRIIACTNGDVEAALKQGTLRPDLFYRLAGSRLRLPPLRERRADIPALAEAFVARAAGEGWRLGDDLLELLVSPALPWPGNLRQLESVLDRAMERARLEAGERVLRRTHVSAADLDLVEAPPAAASLLRPVPAPAPGGLLEAWTAVRGRRSELDAEERRLIERALADADGVVAQAARVLGTSRTGLLSRMQTLGVGRPARGGAEAEADA
jgi:transcriptional regulator with GAF, ATPase, and Fis domain